VQINSRIRIKQLVSNRPGLHLRELQRQLGSSFSSTRYHVNKMTGKGEIDRVDANGYSRLYPPGLSPQQKRVLSALRRGSDSKILLTLLYERCLSQKSLGSITRLAKSTISERLAFLVRDELIQSIQDPITGLVFFSLVDPELVNTLLHQNTGIVARATASFIELWDF
jgi:predicted transcriptional regulator